MKLKIQIKNWFTGRLLFEYEKENNTTKDTLLEAFKSDADLTDADLRDADLRGAVLTGAVLRGADLTGAVLTGAVLTGADLRGADLRDADLRDAVLTGAVLRDADLRGADLTGAVLTGAVLRGADLTGADLRDADLTGAVLQPIKADFFSVLLPAIPEIAGLKAAVIEGRIDGSTYTGECACLVGTIAHVANKHYESIPGIKPDSERPIERFFIGIKKGDTPETNPISKTILEWIEEFESYIRPVNISS